jgi:AcrR family transcriptional regulator
MNRSRTFNRNRRIENRIPAPRAEPEERWQQIVEIATELFRKKGFASTSMQEISDAVGILKGSLYYYMDSKEDLLFRILRGLHSDGEDIIAAVKLDSDDPVQQLREYLRKAVMFASLNADRLAIFLRDFHYVPKERQREIISEREMYSRTVRRLIEEIKAKGLADPKLDVSLVSTFVTSAVSSTHEWLRPDGREPLEAAAEKIADMLVGAVLSRVAAGGSGPGPQPPSAPRRRSASRARSWTGAGKKQAP